MPQMWEGRLFLPAIPMFYRQRKGEDLSQSKHPPQVNVWGENGACWDCMMRYCICEEHRPFTSATIKRFGLRFPPPRFDWLGTFFLWVFFLGAGSTYFWLSQLTESITVSVLQNVMGVLCLFACGAVLKDKFRDHKKAVEHHYLIIKVEEGDFRAGQPW